MMPPNSLSKLSGPKPETFFSFSLVLAHSYANRAGLGPYMVQQWLSLVPQPAPGQKQGWGFLRYECSNHTSQELSGSIFKSLWVYFGMWQSAGWCCTGVDYSNQHSLFWSFFHLQAHTNYHLYSHAGWTYSNISIMWSGQSTVKYSYCRESILWYPWWIFPFPLLGNKRGKEQGKLFSQEIR